MKRRNFLFAPFLALPIASFANFNKKVRPNKPFRVENGKDRFNESITLFEGDTFFTKVSTKDTDGDMFIFESTRIKKGGPPLHYHYEQDEWFYILSGEFLFKVGEETFTAKAGDSVFGPRMIPHAFSKTNEGEAKMIILYQPAGKMEAHFKAVSQGSYKLLSDAEKHKLRQANGFEVVGPALIHEK